MRSDGTGLINLTDDSRYDFDGDWSPDGQQIVFASYDLSPEIYDPAWATGSDQELFLASADGSEIVQLTDTPDQFELLPAWSPDRQYIAFLTFDENWDLHLDLVRPDGGERLRLVSFPSRHFNCAAAYH
ncbi:MAG: PD40 domain-containing protein [Chloroflexi bacterium]|nr:PD40 domain-containing protein [Chloroflexota bacterium]